MKNLITIIFISLFNSQPLLAEEIILNDIETNGYYSQAVSIYGDYAIVGAFNSNFNNLERSGIAYIFKQDDSKWSIQQKFGSPDAQAGDLLGASVSMYEDYAVIGIKYDNEICTNAGSVYILKRTENVWNIEQKLLPSDAQGHDYFGSAVSIYDDYIVVGAYNQNSATGAVYIFKKDVQSWTQEQIISPTDLQQGDSFGSSVSIYKNFAIIGAKGKYEGAGAAYIFQYKNNSWKQLQKLTVSDRQANDSFGGSVSIYSKYAIVTADSDDDNGSNSGAAYIFKYEDEVWSQQQKLLAPNGKSGEYFGLSASIHEEDLIIGAYLDNSKAQSAGAAYIYKLKNYKWNFYRKLYPSQSKFFGYAVAINANNAIIGGNNTAYIFSKEDIDTYNEHPNYTSQLVTIYGYIKDTNNTPISGATIVTSWEVKLGCSL